MHTDLVISLIGTLPALTASSLLSSPGGGEQRDISQWPVVSFWPDVNCQLEQE